VTLEILDSAGALVRGYSSDDTEEPADAMLAIPTYWVRPPRPLSAEPGMHRFIWDLHYTPLTQGAGRGGRASYPMQAIAHDTAPSITSLWVAPGQYVVKLTANGRTYRQPLTVKMDPRVKTLAAGLQLQFTLSKQMYDDAVKIQKTLDRVRAVRNQLQQLRGKAQGAVADELTAFDDKVAALEGGGGGGGRGGRGAVAAGPPTLGSAVGPLTTLMRLLQDADVTPTTQAVAAVADRQKALTLLLDRWTALKGAGLAALNAQLKQAGLGEVTQ
jgi:hypothetical protein